jgi:protein-tyrosine-phosphatase
MAAALARDRFGQVESAGTVAYGDRATAETIQIMQSEYQLDLSGHRPKKLEELDVAGFDCIVAMDSYVHAELLRNRDLAPDMIIQWDIADPFGKGVSAYRKTVREMEVRLESLEIELKNLETGLRGGRRSSVNTQEESSARSILQLRADVKRWSHELDQGMLRGTLLVGIASKAVDSFDGLLREVLEYYLTLCRIDYASTLQDDFDGKSLDQLTIGQVAQAMLKVDKQITKCCRGSLPEAQSLLAHRGLIKPISRKLYEVIRLRNDLHHRFDVFADEPRIVRNVGELLTGIRELLRDAVFEIVVIAGNGRPRSAD